MKYFFKKMAHRERFDGVGPKSWDYKRAEYREVPIDRTEGFPLSVDSAVVKCVAAQTAERKVN